MTEPRCKSCGKKREKLFILERRDGQRINACSSCTIELTEKGWKIVV
ncbi:hypothetical protein MYX07_03155 [Patescibacteria group bacterium AH-259-L07]|nr:hypothetical protein [Patescibacteria group bacterium AH-259-L07]